jgi:hypothetical protein
LLSVFRGVLFLSMPDPSIRKLRVFDFYPLLCKIREFMNII